MPLHEKSLNSNGEYTFGVSDDAADVDENDSNKMQYNQSDYASNWNRENLPTSNFSMNKTTFPI